MSKIQTYKYIYGFKQMNSPIKPFYAYVCVYTYKILQGYVPSTCCKTRLLSQKLPSRVVLCQRMLGVWPMDWSRSRLLDLVYFVQVWCGLMWFPFVWFPSWWVLQMFRWSVMASISYSSECSQVLILNFVQPAISGQWLLQNVQVIEKYCWKDSIL